MSYKLRFSNTFLKKKRRLPGHIINRLVRVMKEIPANPYNNGIRLAGDLEGLWKKRIGKYRIVSEIIENEKIVVFHTIDLRKKIYRTL